MDPHSVQYVLYFCNMALLLYLSAYSTYTHRSGINPAFCRIPVGEMKRVRRRRRRGGGFGKIDLDKQRARLYSAI